MVKFAIYFADRSLCIAHGFRKTRLGILTHTPSSGKTLICTKPAFESPNHP
jgi:hypothetical protein